MRPDHEDHAVARARLLVEVLGNEVAVAERDALLAACLRRLDGAAAASRALLDDVLSPPQQALDRAEIWGRLHPVASRRGPRVVVALALLLLAVAAWTLLDRGASPTATLPAPAPSEPRGTPAWLLTTRPVPPAYAEARAAQVVRTVRERRGAAAYARLMLVSTSPRPLLAPWRNLTLPVDRIGDETLLALLPGRGAALVSVGPDAKELRFLDPADEARLLGTPR